MEDFLVVQQNQNTTSVICATTSNNSCHIDDNNIKEGIYFHQQSKHRHHDINRLKKSK